MKDFVVFILTHGRANRVRTYGALRAQGYTGRVVFVLDDEDEQYPLYAEKYGAENIVRFSKEEVSKTFDEIQGGNRKTIVYARNACFQIARDLGYRYFLELDDDYDEFSYRFSDKLKYVTFYRSVKNLDNVFSYMLEYLKSMPPHVVTIAFGQAGDLIGGGTGTTCSAIRTKRKAMNSFFCDVERPFKFVGRINEDVNAYTLEGSRGQVFLTVFFIIVVQETTQKSSGGMTDVYIDGGTYIKSIFSVINMPSAVKIATMGSSNKRIHHQVSWKNCVPCILDEKYRKSHD